MKVALFGLVASASARFLARAPDGPDCGRGFDALNDGTKAYFDTIEENLWTHPGNQHAFNTCNTELKCWFAKMVAPTSGEKCGGNTRQEGRNKDSKLHNICNTPEPANDGQTVNNLMTEAEFKWWHQTFPKGVPHDEDAELPPNFNQAMNTCKAMNTKEFLCTTMRVIDDNCVDSKYVRKE